MRTVLIVIGAGMLLGLIIALADIDAPTIQAPPLAPVSPPPIDYGDRE
jgi:hypothetical protein